VNVRAPSVLVAALCVGLAASNAARLPSLALAAAAVGMAALAVGVQPAHRVAVFAAALACAGWWWGSVRLAALDRSVLAGAVGTAERARLEVTAPARPSRYQLRVPVLVRRFGARQIHEAALLELPPGRAPPQGALLSAVVTVEQPRGPDHGFDERTWLRRKGIHVALRADRWHLVGRRGGFSAVADRLRTHVERSLARGASGERGAVLAGVVLGDDQAVAQTLRDRFRASGLYHLLAVSGQNVAFVAVGVLVLAAVLGVPRLIAEVCALAGIAAYVLAVGAQPSVVRAGIVGALGSLAWLAARQRDRWHFLLIAAFVLLAWNPYTLLDAGFQLSFAAVTAIFVLVRPLIRILEGYPLTGWLREAIAVSTACSVATAPVLWLQFHAVPLLAVPANALAAPAMAPLLGLALSAALLDPISPGAAAVLADLAGWCAAWLALCARAIGGLPFAQVRSTRGAAALAGCALLAAAYAWRRWRSSSRSI
jgi:competence protein ComEC